jgi:hypothetical protein
MTFQPGANLYTQGFGSRPEDVEVPHLEARPPSASDTNYPIGKRWMDTSTGSEYSLGNITITNGITSANWGFLGSSSGDLNSLTTEDAFVVDPSAGTINLVGTGSTTTSGSGNTATVALTGLTNHNVLIGAGTATITKVAPSATSGVALVSTGAAADPAFGTVVVAGGGTGLTTLTAHQLYVGNGTSAPNTVVNGTTGQVLTAVTGADPTFQNPAASSISITGDSGGALTGNAFTFTGGTSGLTFAGAGSTETLGGTLVVANGGTGATTLTGVLTGNGTSTVTANAVTQHGVVLGGASNAVSSLAVAATGTVLAGSTGADPAFTGSPSVSGSLTAATTITATLGAITATNGNLVMGTAGNKIIVPTGANASAGTSGNMSGTPGAVTVATTASSGTAKVFYCRNVTGGTPGEVSITAQDGTGFTLTSTGNETSTFNWWIINA